MFGRNIFAQPVSDEPQEEYPFLYNYTHDLESMLWVLVYFLILMRPREETVPGHIHVERLGIFERLFLEGYHRSWLLQGNASLVNSIKRVVPQRFLDSWKNIAFPWLGRLTTLYAQMQQSSPPGNSFSLELYSTVLDSGNAVLRAGGWDGEVTNQFSLRGDPAPAEKRKAEPDAAAPAVGSTSKRRKRG